MPSSAARSGFNPWKVFALLLLVAGTCGAVALLVSVWLVPPYLVVMALILFPTGAPQSNPASLTSPSGPTDPPRDQADPGGDGEVTAGLAEASAARPASDGSAGSGGTSPTLDPVGSASPTATMPAKPKRSRSRPRKVKPTAEVVEPAPATWMEVGPGKFVRVETSGADALAASPHFDVAPAPLLAPDPIGTISSADSSADAVAVGADSPDQAAEPVVIEPIITLPGIIFDPVDESHGSADAPDVADAPAIVALESPSNPIPVALRDLTRVEEPSLINPTIDGTTLQVEVDADLDLVHGPIPKPSATEVAPDSTPDAWLCAAPDLGLAPLIPTGLNDGPLEADQDQVMSDLAMRAAPVEVVVDREIDATAAAEPILMDQAITADLPARRVIRSQRGGWSQPPQRLTPRGATGRVGPLPRRPTSSRLRQRREVRRPYPIAWTARPRSPPVVRLSR